MQEAATTAARRAMLHEKLRVLREAEGAATNDFVRDRLRAALERAEGEITHNMFTEEMRALQLAEEGETNDFVRDALQVRIKAMRELLHEQLRVLQEAEESATNEYVREALQVGMKMTRAKLILSANSTSA